MSDPANKVYVSAFVCSDLIEEQGTKMLSALRISGGFLVRPGLIPTEDSKIVEWGYPKLNIFVVVIFNCDSPATFYFQMRAKTPSGDTIDLSEQLKFPDPFTIGSGAEGLTLKAIGSLPGSVPGDYWIEMVVNGVLANRVPVRIVHPPEFQDFAINQPPAAGSPQGSWKA